MTFSLWLTAASRRLGLELPSSCASDLPNAHGMSKKRKLLFETRYKKVEKSKLLVGLRS